MKINKFKFLSFLFLLYATNYAALASDPLVLPGRLAANLSNTPIETLLQPTGGNQTYSQSLNVSKDEGFCYLSALSTKDNYKGVTGRVYLTSDNKWWIDAAVGKNNYVAAECIKWA